MLSPTDKDSKMSITGSKTTHFVTKFQDIRTHPQGLIFIEWFMFQDISTFTSKAGRYWILGISP